MTGRTARSCNYPARRVAPGVATIVGLRKLLSQKTLQPVKISAMGRPVEENSLSMSGPVPSPTKRPASKTHRHLHGQRLYPSLLPSHSLGLWHLESRSKLPQRAFRQSPAHRSQILDTPPQSTSSSRALNQEAAMESRLLQANAPRSAAPVNHARASSLVRSGKQSLRSIVVALTDSLTGLAPSSNTSRGPTRQSFTASDAR